MFIKPETGLVYGIPGSIVSPGSYTFYVEAIDPNRITHYKKVSIKINEFEIQGITRSQLMVLYDRFTRDFDFKQSKGPYIGTGTTTYQDLGESELRVIFKQENLINYDLFKRQVVSMASVLPSSSSVSSKIGIDKILHIVWFTNKTDPKEIEKLFAKHNPYIDHNINRTSSWKKRILWINDPEKLPTAIGDKLKKNGVEIKSLSRIPLLLEKAVQKGAISKEEEARYNALHKLVHFYIEKSNYGSATDIARYLVMFLYGGVYLDGDYRIDDVSTLEKLMADNDSFFGVERDWDIRLGNAFLASKKYGKVIKGVLDLSFRNTTAILPGNNAPNYIKYPYQWDMGVIFRTGPIALTVAFAKHKGEEQSKMLEYCSIFQSPDNNSCNYYPNKLGKHDFAVSWMKPNK